MVFPCRVRRAVCELEPPGQLPGAAWPSAPGKAGLSQARAWAPQPCVCRAVLAPFWGQLGDVVPCQRLLGLQEGAQRDSEPVWALPRLPRRGTLAAFHSPFRINAHSAGVLFLFFLCSLWSFRFHASRESERGVCGYDLNLFACF